MFKFRKIDLLVHKISLHELLMNMRKFSDVTNALDQIGNKRDTTAIESFNQIINNLSKSEKLIKRTKEKFINLKSTYDVWKNLNVYDARIPSLVDTSNTSKRDEGINSESFMYKHIIETVIWETELWEELIKQLKLEKENLEDLRIYQEEFEKMKELKGMHMYLNKLNFKNLFFSNKRKKDIEKEEIETKFKNYLSEIEGITNRLEYLLKDCLSRYNNNIPERNAKETMDNIDNKDLKEVLKHFFDENPRNVRVIYTK